MNLNTGSWKSHYKASSNTIWYGRQYIGILQRQKKSGTWSLGSYDLWRCMLIANYFTLNNTITLLSNVSRCKRGISVKWCICGRCRDISLFHCGQTRCCGICCGSLKYQKIAYTLFSLHFIWHFRLYMSVLHTPTIHEWVLIIEVTQVATLPSRQNSLCFPSGFLSTYA